MLIDEGAGAPLAWRLITRLGEAQLLLPAMAAMLLWLVLRRGAWRLAIAWTLSTGIAALLTTASKIAFIGYGLGYAPWNFTGLSGHAMFAAAILPILCRLAEGWLPPAWHGRGLAAGYGLAALVAVSRVPVQAHTVSEALSGFVLGAAASAATLLIAHAPRLRISAWLPLALAGGLSLGVAKAPPSRTHDLVTQLSLALSGRATPYTRHQMLREYRHALQPAAVPRQQQAASCQASGTSNESPSKPLCSITRVP
ncbi:phosphatase PAP2 family protein [Aquabacterium sp.]|uniref:phosphatase PAP2 family protein n=1 Tax=Aquabacterium sp. TaxID=1872578 RepID=UPI002C0B8BF1|nr:phosphatase PAP2 family protein [Aquabacterium sp.]HSW08826.1 phosphatase PAP2 family protein [Aquabacterium sp.]